MDRRRRALALGILGAGDDVPAIELSAPIGGAAVNNLYPEFTWEVFEGATTYDIEVATDAAFTNIVLTETGIADTTWTADASLPSALYYWRVTSDNGGSSAVGTFNLSVFEFQVTTTGASQTFTLQAMDVAVGEEIEITWGDGTPDNTYTTTGTRSHVYVTADTYDVRIGGAEHITAIDWRDGKMVVNMNNNASKLSGVTNYVALRNLSGLTWDVGSSAGAAFPAVTSYVYLYNLSGLTWDVGSSAGAAFPALTSYVNLESLPGLTWDVGSSAGAAFPAVTSSVFLRNLPGLTWNVGSSAGAAFPAVTDSVRLESLPGLTWNVGSSPGAAMPAVTSYVTLRSLSGLTWADYGQIPNNVNSFTIYNNLDNTAVNAFINGMWGRRAAFLKATTWNLDTTNDAPSGTYQAACPPTSAREQIYELINDSCGEGFVKQTAITVTA